MKEQSLVISFEDNPDYQEGEPDSLKGGIASEHAVLIENTFPSLGNNASSYFAYEKMEMFVYGGDPESNCNYIRHDPDENECNNLPDSTEVGLLFRIGKDDNNYYEIQDVEKFLKHINKFHSSGSSIHEENGYVFLVDDKSGFCCNLFRAFIKAIC